MYESLINFSLLQCTQELSSLPFSICFNGLLTDWLPVRVCVCVCSKRFLRTRAYSLCKCTAYPSIYMYIIYLYVFCLLYLFILFFLPARTIRCAFKFQCLAAFWHRAQPRSSQVEALHMFCLLAQSVILLIELEIHLYTCTPAHLTLTLSIMLRCFSVAFFDNSRVNVCVSIVYRFYFMVYDLIWQFFWRFCRAFVYANSCCMENVSPNPKHVDISHLAT